MDPLESWMIIPLVPVATAIVGIIVMSVVLVRRRLKKEH